MPYIVWRASFSVGVSSIDSHHRKILEIINDLHTLMQRGKAEAHYMDVIRELKAYAAYHFVHEESMMEEAGYPGAAMHKANHEGYREKVDELARVFKEQPEDLLNFVKDWWSNHIMRMDMQYKEPLREYRRQKKVEEKWDKKWKD